MIYVLIIFLSLFIIWMGFNLYFTHKENKELTDYINDHVKDKYKL